MLKQVILLLVTQSTLPAAFGRLCVETISVLQGLLLFSQPPSGGCVLKLVVAYM